MSFLLLAPILFFPFFSDLFSLPKLFLLSITALFFGARLTFKKNPSFPLLLPISLFLLADLLSIANAVNWWEWYQAVSIDLMGVIVFYYVVNFAKEESLYHFLLLFVVVAALVSAGALSAYYLHWPESLANFYRGRGGTMGNPNFAAVLIGLAIPICVFLCTARIWPLLPILALLSTHGWLTINKTLIVALGATVCVWWGILKPFHKVAAVVLGMFALTTVLLFKLPFPNFSLGPRLAWWYGSILIERDYPVFGTGRGNWPFVYPIYALSAGDKTMNTQELNLDPGKQDIISKVFVNAAHNDYLQILAETGLLGLVGLLWFLVGIVQAGWRAERESTRWLFLAWLTFPVQMFFGFPFQMAELVVWFWVFGGLILSPRRHPAWN